MICKKCKQDREPEAFYTARVNGVEYLRTNKCRICTQVRKPDPLTPSQKRLLRRTLKKFHDHMDTLIQRQEEAIDGKL